MARCPNATEIDSSGTSNIPYTFQDTQIDRRTFQDVHPLMNPVAIPNFPLALPSVLPSQEPELFPTVPIVATAVAIVFVVAGLLVYFKKRKR